MRKLALVLAASALLATVPLGGAHAEVTYCYAARPGAEGGCVYKAAVAGPVTVDAAGGWILYLKHKKKITRMESGDPEVPTTFQLQLAKGDVITLTATHIGSAIAVTGNN